jgi:hypothetical protein
LKQEKEHAEAEKHLTIPSYLPTIAATEKMLLRWSPMLKKRAKASITPAVLLGHMQGMERRLRSEIGGVRSDLVKTEVRLNTRIDRVERDIAWIKVSVGNIDKRLDTIEVVQVPRLEKAVGMR